MTLAWTQALYSDTEGSNCECALVPAGSGVAVPTFIVDWAAQRLADATATATASDPIERRYALRLVKQRLHQAAFRDVVVSAYDHRCAISNLPDDHLLDAAHIMVDGHELLGQPVVANGIALSKIHHPAFDNHLNGIDPDGRVHVSERLLRLHDVRGREGLSAPASPG
jgi:putative restriction endonuclease